MIGLVQDVRYALRPLRKDPGFTTVAFLMLALGIGRSTSSIQLLTALRLRTLPVQNPQEPAEVKIVGGNRGMGLNQQYGERTQPLLLAVGIMAGLVFALAGARGAGSRLYDLEPNDPLTFAVASALLSMVALFAGFVPAYKASRTNPVVALGYE
jgi:ABC-type antimicrobial peptide transport system permease subunit